MVFPTPRSLRKSWGYSAPAGERSGRYGMERTLAQCEMDDHLGSPRCRVINIKPQKLNSQKWSTQLQLNKNEKKKQTTKLFLYVHTWSGKAVSLRPCRRGRELLRYSQSYVNSPSSWTGVLLGIWALSQSQHSTKTECCEADCQGTASTELQEDSCPIIGICVFVLVVSLQNTSVKVWRMCVTSIADRFFYAIHQSNVLCAFSCVCYMNYPCINTVYNRFHFCYRCIRTLWVALLINFFPPTCLEVMLCSAPPLPCWTASCFSRGAPCCRLRLPAGLGRDERLCWDFCSCWRFCGNSRAGLIPEGLPGTGIAVRAAVRSDAASPVFRLGTCCKRRLSTSARQDPAWSWLEKQSWISPHSPKSLLQIH